MKHRQTDKGRAVESDTRQRQRKTDEQRQNEDMGESEVSLGDPWPTASISGASGRALELGQLHTVDKHGLLST